MHPFTVDLLSICYWCQICSGPNPREFLDLWVDRACIVCDDRTGRRGKLARQLFGISAQGAVDEIVIVDTGSQGFGPWESHQCGGGTGCCPFTWIDDFAAATPALAHATGDYAFWLYAKSLELPVAGGLGLDWGFGVCGLFGSRRRDSSNGPVKDLHCLETPACADLCVSGPQRKELRVPIGVTNRIERKKLLMPEVLSPTGFRLRDLRKMRFSFR